MTPASPLKQKTIRALAYNFFDKAGTQLLAFVISIILARILVPRHFGLIAMVNVFIQLANTFVDSGFGMAVIQKKDLKDSHIASVFYFNLFVAILFYSVLFFCAGFIAEFYEEPELVLITRVLGLNLIINAIGSIQLNLMVKQLDYSSQLRASIIGAVVGGSIAIALATNGYGVWSIVAQVTIMNVIKNGYYWFASTVKIVGGFSKSAFQSMVGFSYKILLASILDIVFTNLYVLLIGKFYSTSQLGYYRRAKSLQEMPTTLIAKIQKVIFPSLSNFQDDNEKLKSIFRESVRLTAFITAPLMALLAIIAEPLVLFLLTAKWLPSVSFIQVFCIAGLAFTLSSLVLNLLFIKGNSGLYLKTEFIKKAIMLGILIPSLYWGIMGIVAGYAIASLICHLINVYYAGKTVGYTLAEHMKDIFPSILYTLFLIAPSLWLGELFESSLLKLVAQVLLAGILYLGGTYLLKAKELRSLLSLMRLTKHN